MPRMPAFSAALPLARSAAAGGALRTPTRARRAPAAPACRRVRAPAMSAVGADPNDVLLGELAFTEPDNLPAVIEARLAEGALTDDFYKYVEAKVNASADLEERETLRLLVEAVKQLAEEIRTGVATAAGGGGGDGGSGSAVVEEVDDEAAAEAGYDEVIDRFVAACAESDAEAALAANIEFNYESIDKRFLDRLNVREEEAAEGDKAALATVKTGIAAAMGKRVNEAADKLKSILTAGDPNAMKRELETVAAKGGLDEALILLLQANIQQATEAGMEPAVVVMSGILDHARMLKESKLSPEVRLIRRLLRADDEETRQDLLMTALKPSKGVALADGTVTTGVKVNGKKFVEELRGLIEMYSNVEEAFAMRLSKLGEESEEAARKIFDMEDKDVKDVQDEAFHKRSVSVWDLEQIEMKEEVEGRKADWEGRLGAIPQGFDEHGKMSI